LFYCFIVVLLNEFLNSSKPSKLPKLPKLHPDF
jgi:hypothetical protein